MPTCVIDLSTILTPVFKEALLECKQRSWDTDSEATPHDSIHLLLEAAAEYVVGYPTYYAERAHLFPIQVLDLLRPLLNQFVIDAHLIDHMGALKHLESGYITVQIKGILGSFTFHSGDEE